MQLWPDSIKLIHVGTQHLTNPFPSALSCVLVHSLYGELAVMVVSVSPARLSQARVLSGGICFRGSSVIGSDNGERCCRLSQFVFFSPPQRKSLGCEIKLKKRPHEKANIRACVTPVSPQRSTPPAATLTSARPCTSPRPTCACRLSSVCWSSGQIPPSE